MGWIDIRQLRSYIQIDSILVVNILITKPNSLNLDIKSVCGG